jgi:hypothetical protein
MEPHDITPEQAASWEHYLVDDGAGGQRMAGCEPRVHGIGHLPVGAPGEFLQTWDGTIEDCPVLPDSELVTNDALRIWEWDDIDQNGYPACCLAAWANAIELFLARAGRAKTNLDWYRAWYTLSGGRGGVDIGTALQFIMREGFPLADKSGVVRIVEAWEAPSVAAYLSGLERGCVGVFGHDAHAECGASVVNDASGKLVDTRNSWGDSGRWHLFPANRIDIRNYGAFLIRDLELRPIDTTGWADVP